MSLVQKRSLRPTGDAVEGAAVLPGHDFGLGGRGCSAGVVVKARDEGVEPRLRGFYASQEGVGDLYRGHLFAPNALGQLGDGEPCQVLH